jgi:hypothetical protein
MAIHKFLLLPYKLGLMYSCSNGLDFSFTSRNLFKEVGLSCLRKHLNIQIWLSFEIKNEFILESFNCQFSGNKNVVKITRRLHLVFSQ